MSIFFPEDEGREVPNVDNQPILRTEIIAGAAGPTGSQGAKGDTGATGAGVVTGGLTGQVLAKKTNADYDTEWVTGGGAGAAIWGGIAGTLSNQTDLQTVLDAKAPSSGISPSAISGTAVITTDSRLSDSRTPTGAASGDLSGTFPAPEVIKLRGYSVSLTSPSDNQAILFNSSATAFQNSTLTIGTISGLSADLSGKVTAVSGTSPIVSSGGTTPTISMPVATATTNGYLSSTDWSTFNSKQAAGTYVTSVTGTTPIVSSGGTTPAISIPVATAATSGYLASADWSTFNAKAKTTDVQIFTRGTLYTTTATAFTSGSATITVASNANMVVGMAITAPFLPAQSGGIPTTITNISGTTITVSGNATYSYSDRNIATTIGFATSLYTWTKPTGAKSVDVFCIAGGGAGAGGRVNAGLQGGGAGAGGGLNFRTQIPATILAATEPVFVGIEGIGGTATNQINSQNIPGGTGFDSSFGAISAITTNPFVFAGGGGGGSGAAGGNGSAGIRNVNVAGAGGAGGSAAAGAAGSSSLISAAGGGGGGGANTTSFFNGGNGQWVLGNNPVGGQAQSSGVEGTNGVAGTSMGTSIHAGGGGSGGVGAYTGKNAGAGGNGGLYGGGGGGGGCLGNFNASFFSGKGGDGGQGIVIVTTYF